MSRCPAGLRVSPVARLYPRGRLESASLFSPSSLRPFPAPTGPCSWPREFGAASTPAISSAPCSERAAGPGGTAGRAGGRAGLGTAGRRRPAWGGRRCPVGPARLSAGSGFFRERLPWVTSLRGDTVLPSPSGNLSIREIDNPQRRAAHPLGSPALGRATQSGATRPRGRSISGPVPHPGPGPLLLVGEGRLQRISLGALPVANFPEDRALPQLVGDQSLCWSSAAGMRGAPWWLGQNFVESSSGFFR